MLRRVRRGPARRRGGHARRGGSARAPRAPAGARIPPRDEDGGNGRTAYGPDSFAAIVRELPPKPVRHHQSRGDFARRLREPFGDGEVAAGVEGLDDPVGIAEQIDDEREVLWNRLN